MTASEEHFEQLVADMLADVAPSRPPIELIPNAEQAVSGARRRPRWLASIKEPPMRYASQLAVGSPTARVAAIMVATLLIATMVASAGIAGSRLFAASGTIVVDQSGNGTVTTITEAVGMAEDGDTILVRPGTYVEVIVIDKDIMLSGDGPRDEIIIMAPEGGPTNIVELGLANPYAMLLTDTAATLSFLTFRGEPSAIHLSGGSPTLEGLVMDGVGQPDTGPAGRYTSLNSIAINGDSTATVSGNTLLDAGPIVIYEDSKPSVVGNTLVDGASILALTNGDGTTIRDNVISGTIDRAIGVFGRGKATVEGNTISDAGGDGITVGLGSSPGTDPIVRDNVVSGSSTGIGVAAAANPVIDGNTLIENEIGFFVSNGSDDLLVANNDFNDNRIGISIVGSDGRFADNSVRGGTSGIVILSLAAPDLTGNTVEGASDYGVLIGEGTSPTLQENRICDNGQNLLFEGGDNQPIGDTNEICEDTSAE